MMQQRLIIILLSSLLFIFFNSNFFENVQGSSLDTTGGNNSSSTVYINDNLGFTGGAMTMVVWGAVDAQPGTDVNMTLLNKGQSGASIFTNIVIGYEDSAGTKRNFYCRLRRGVADDCLLVSRTLTLGAWNCYAITFDSGTTGEGFFNGVSEGTFSSSGNGSGGGNTRLQAGGLDQEAWRIWDGKIAHVSVYDAVLSLATINKLCTSRPRSNEPNVRVYWPLDGVQSTSTVEDHSDSNNLDGLASSSYSLVDEHPPEPYK